ncbi:glycosyltransferase [Glaciibacter psychrotolerans]|uniref:MGT family glycosyltransferase n=1 Tax=Glaciibacter psychrotolerans TaxID=670054 RepID=A0A7Z0EHB4_9MICO|nr:glycosyltransferase [Leifsonia psychrotolerans]NYJ21493.1 MGT family glycosyltransferase [Leifsonia psychrotolerans]
MASLLICCTPVHGHVAPLLAAATSLVTHGHRVRFLTGAKYRGKVEATGAEFLPLPQEADYDDADLDAAFPGRVGRSGIDGIRYDMTTIFVKPMPAQARAVEAAIAAESVDVILSEPMFTGLAALVDRPGRPAIVSLGIIPLGLPSPDTAPMGFGLPPMKGPVGRVRNALLSSFAEHVAFAPVQKEASRLATEVSGQPLDGFFMNWLSKADAVVQFTVAEFEYPRRATPLPVHFVGPIARTVPSEGALPDWWDELDGSRPVIHVTQGTVANKNYDELIAPAMLGLCAEDALVVVSTGGRAVSTLPHPLPANVRAAEYLPYDKLLPLTDVLVTNGGYGGVHYAMEHGVPLVVAGTTEDKVEVTARVAWSGVGVNLRTNKPTPGAIGDAVRRVRGTPSFRVASASIGRKIAASSGLDGLNEVVVKLAESR